MANETRLIDANKLDSDLLGTLIPDIFSKRKRRFTVGEVRTLLQKAPTVDAVEAVHGRWEWFDDEECGLYRCSCCCGAVGYPTNYCPNCGAKMDGERREGE